jgi:hypothetical protein
MDRMDVQQIIKKDSKETGENFQETYAQLHAAIEDNVLRVMRDSNSLYIYKFADKEADGYIATADEGKVLAKAIQNFGLAMQKAGFTRATIASKNEDVVRVMRGLGLDYYRSIPSSKGAPMASFYLF